MAIPDPPPGPDRADSDKTKEQQEMATEGDQNPPSAPPSKVNKWQFYSAFATIAGLVLIVLIVVRNVKGTDDSAVAVLGVVIPAFATIGAAVFGVSSAYQAGKSSGEETGKAEGSKDKAEAVAKARKRVAEGIRRDADAGALAHRRLRDNVLLASSSETNVQGYSLYRGEAPLIVPSDLDDPLLALERIRARCEAIVADDL